jgi:flagellin
MLTEAATVVASPSMDNGTGAGSFSVMFSSGDTLTMTASFGTGTANAATVSGGTVSFTGAEVEMLNFAVGTGTDETADQIEVSVGSINTTALGLDGTDLLSRSSAEQTNGAIDTALDTLANRRSDVAAAQNRLDAAQNNVDAAVQNQSAANSSLIELNVADASTEFSQNQVRFQAASSTLTQAQQLPQNLLGLFQ